MYTQQDRETVSPLTGQDVWTQQDRETVAPLTGQDVYTEQDRETVSPLTGQNLTRLPPRDSTLDGRWTRKPFGLSRVQPIYLSIPRPS